MRLCLLLTQLLAHVAFMLAEKVRSAQLTPPTGRPLQAGPEGRKEAVRLTGFLPVAVLC